MLRTPTSAAPRFSFPMTVSCVAECGPIGAVECWSPDLRAVDANLGPWGANGNLGGSPTVGDGAVGDASAT